MMWFGVNILYKSEHERGGGEPLWEEQIVLFQADDETQVHDQATRYGKSQEHEYRNRNGELIHWVFVRIERVFEIEAAVLENGTEVFSRFLRDAEVKSLLTPFDEEDK